MNEEIHMLTYEQRVTRYLAQTGRIWNGAGRPPLTPRQRRRAMHKLAHQWEVPAQRRAERSAARAKVRAARQHRRAEIPVTR
ncbi:hypothetical protein [Nonomuraea sp. 10N515B]|uniref:hypothetical protein n=1 Tax=Nonomuraea sp. 10N515B TaxID=3457422 RepID=UPI003FCE405C